MKRILLLSISMLFLFSIHAQQRAKVSKSLQNYSVQKEIQAPADGSEMLTGNVAPYKSANFWAEETIGETYYDKQSNRVTANRLYRFDDGTMATTWTYAIEATGFADRGTGYNYYDGNNWGDWPEARVETVKTGWPTAAYRSPCGPIALASGSPRCRRPRRPDW